MHVYRELVSKVTKTLIPQTAFRLVYGGTKSFLIMALSSRQKPPGTNLPVPGWKLFQNHMDGKMGANLVKVELDLLNNKSCPVQAHLS